ncbi:MAG: inositol monophosphatase [Betaproteobacteria bacterium]|nr:inositol monophosphatase [Betaproteobacteria bacterium]
MTHRILNIATLNIAVKAARRASQIINRASMNIQHLEVANKQIHDYVTEVDREAEAAIIRILTESCPDFGILAEESGEQNTGRSEFRWIIDPLDGTTNFIHGFPQYAVSIALAKGNQIEQGVVFDPTRNELFTAARGQGAYLNEKRIRVSARIRLDEALLGTGFPFRNFTHMDSYLAILRELAQKTSGLRRPGAASLDLAYVAAGRLDGFWESGLAPWDMAAGSILITEAGGLVCDFSGEANYLSSGNIVAGTPRIFHPLLQIVQNHCPETLRA